MTSFCFSFLPGVAPRAELLCDLSALNSFILIAYSGIGNLDSDWKSHFFLFNSRTCRICQFQSNGSRANSTPQSGNPGPIISACQRKRKLTETLDSRMARFHFPTELPRIRKCFCGSAKIHSICQVFPFYSNKFECQGVKIHLNK